MAVPETLSQAVRLRADGRCQYCLMHESLQGATFHVEHIIPQSKGGHSVLENLALASPGCNLHKADRTTDQAIEFPLPDEQGRRQLVRLYACGLTLTDETVELVVKKTKNASAAFIKELM